MLDWVLDHQRADAAGRRRHARAHGRALPRRAQGLLPGAGHRRHPGHLRGARSRSRSRAMAERQQALARVVLEDPAVESLSSFIGVDGTNATLNSGRMLINLKPLDERDATRAEVIRRLQPRARATVAGITLYMQPVQDLTDRGPRQPHAVPVHARARRPRGAGDAGRRGWSSGCARCRSSPTSRATCRTRACRPTSTIDRDTAGAARRHAGGDRQRALQRLRPAPGLDDLHAVEPVPRGARGGARVPARARRRSNDIYVAVARSGAQVPLVAIARVDRATGAARDQHIGPVPGGDDLVQPRARRLARRGGRRDRAAERELGLPASDRRPRSRARRTRSAPRSPTSCC